MEQDPVMQLLRSTKITYKDIDALCAGFEPSVAEEIMLAFQIMTTLDSYIAETQGWSFAALEKFDFNKQARQFDFDIAILVGDRSERLLGEVGSWGVQKLKDKVANATDTMSDATTVLTILVLRIISKYADLEFKLQLAISRATLVKIHSELGGLVSTMAQGQEVEDASRLSITYRAFVMQLLQEIETTPFDHVQQEMFQVVRDLQSMFVNHAKTREENDETTTDPEFADHEVPPSMESSWASDHYTQSSQPYRPSFKRRHQRTFSSTSSVFSSASSAKSTSTSITEELPSIMAAFDSVRAPPTSSLVSASHRLATPHSIASNPRSVPKQQFPHTLTHYNPNTAKHSSTTHLLTHQPSSENLQVKMVGERMMVNVSGRFVDMQDWLNNKNKAPVSPIPPSDIKQFPSSVSAFTKPLPAALSSSSQATPRTTGLAASLPRRWLNAESKFESNYVDAMDNF